jgi:hypothetical protein
VIRLNTAKVDAVLVNSASSSSEAKEVLLHVEDHLFIPIDTIPQQASQGRILPRYCSIHQACESR